MTDAAADPVRERVEMTLRLIVGGVARAAEPPMAMVRTLVRIADGCLLGRGLYGGDRPVPAPTTESDTDRTDADTDTDDIDAAAAPAAGRPTGSVTADGLPIDDYEHLAASQIVSRLERLDHDALERVAEFERVHRHRRTVLGKIDRLLTAE